MNPGSVGVKKCYSLLEFKQWNIYAFPEKAMCGLPAASGSSLTSWFIARFANNSTGRLVTWDARGSVGHGQFGTVAPQRRRALTDWETPRYLRSRFDRIKNFPVTRLRPFSSGLKWDQEKIEMKEYSYKCLVYSFHTFIATVGVAYFKTSVIKNRTK